MRRLRRTQSRPGQDGAPASLAGLTSQRTMHRMRSVSSGAQSVCAKYWIPEFPPSGGARRCALGVQNRVLDDAMTQWLRRQHEQLRYQNRWNGSLRCTNGGLCLTLLVAAIVGKNEARLNVGR